MRKCPEMTQDPATNFHGRPDTQPFPRIIAHRGASRVAPENTLSAFRIAALQGARACEFDVSLLGDGTPVMHHDATLDRCTDRTGPLAALGVGDLDGIDSGSWRGMDFAGEPLATLDQGLGLIDELRFLANLEMKPHEAPPEPIAEAVARALRARPWTRARIFVSSFDIGALAALRARMPDQPLAVLYEDPPADWPQTLAGLAASGLHIWREFVTPEVLATARKAGFHVRVYTVNDPASMAPYRDGLAGIITDHPPLFLDDPAWAAWEANA